MFYGNDFDNFLQVAVSQVCFYLDYNLDDSYTGSALTNWLSFLLLPIPVNIVNPHRRPPSEYCHLYCFYRLCFLHKAKKVSIRSGTSNHDLIDITAIELNEPVRIVDWLESMTQASSYSTLSTAPSFALESVWLVRRTHHWLERAPASTSP